jgi:hypothetical protein
MRQCAVRLTGKGAPAASQGDWDNENPLFGHKRELQNLPKSYFTILIGRSLIIKNTCLSVYDFH